jgi:XTP/dITP diphosphohydrolase
MKQDLMIATKNPGKLIEIKKLLKGMQCNVVSLLDYINIPDVDEDGATFKENALKKALTISKELKMITVADDSGIEVMALDRRPGIMSARYAGPKPTSDRLCKKLLKEMANRSDRKARFVCDIAIVSPKGKVKVVEGACWGHITDKMMGGQGFGYDPVFIPVGHKKTFAQMSPMLKNKISHRAKALNKAKAYIARLLPA